MKSCGVTIQIKPQSQQLQRCLRQLNCFRLLNPSTSPLKSVFDSSQLSGSINIQDSRTSFPKTNHGSCFKILLLCRLAIKAIDHFTVVGLVSQPLSECEAEVDLLLIQTSFFFLWKSSSGQVFIKNKLPNVSWRILCIKKRLFPSPIKNTSQHKKNIIYIRKQDKQYQNKVNSTALFLSTGYLS